MLCSYFASKVLNARAFIFVLPVCLLATFLQAISQSDMAAVRHTRLVNNFPASSIPAPPGNEQTSRELNEIKELMNGLDEKSKGQVLYWDAGSPSYRWNQLATSLITFEDFVTFTRVPSAWMNLAIYDATVIALDLKDKYRRVRPSIADPAIKTLVKTPETFAYPCERTVTAAAAAKVLGYFYPLKADSILMLAKEAAQSRVNGGVQYPSDVQAAWKIGDAIADKIINEAKMDRSDAKWKGTMKQGPVYWTGDFPVGITTGSFRPLLLKSGDQFRPPPPPDFTGEMQKMKEFKQDPHTIQLAHYLAALSGFDIWTELASQKIFEYRLQDDPLACSQIYTLLHVAMHDASIAIMDAKYAYWGIRPFQFDKTFKPLIHTPPFPGYPSGHAAASSTAATVLGYFFPLDAAFFDAKAKECADSRFYAGIHFTSDNTVGLDMGKKLGHYIVQTWIRHDQK